MSSGSVKDAENLEKNVVPKNQEIDDRVEKKSPKEEDKYIGANVGKMYQIVKMLGKGSFGICYEGIDTTNGHKVAIKLEAKNCEIARNLMKREISCYRKLEGIDGIPKLLFHGKDDGIYLVVLQLLGYDLEKLFEKCSHKFSPKTIFMLAEQMIIRVKSIHSRFLMHRDLKPENFLIGINESEKNKLFLIDFGLTKAYMDSKTKKHVPLIGGKSFTGTVRYCSINAHLGQELSRRDDLESVAYILIYFFLGSLPWDGWKSNIEDKLYVEVKNKKSGILVEELCANLPPVLGQFLSYCRELDFEEEPNYNYWQKMFVKQQFELQFDWDYQFDWIKDESKLTSQ